MSEGVTNIVLLSSWSSGSTAVAGYLARLGVHTAPPHQPTNDPLTPDSHESRALRRALVRRVDEFSLAPRASVATAPFREWLRDWIEAEHEHAIELGASHMLLKHPLLALFIEDLRAICKPRFVIVTRDLESIERTRRRRGWHAVYGRAGALALYEHIRNAGLMDAGEALLCPFERFRSEPEMRESLCRWLGLQVTSSEIAEQWLR